MNRNRIIIVSVVVVLLLLILGWCNRYTLFGTNLGQGAELIPKDVDVVTVFDVPRIVSKLDFEEIRSANNYGKGLANLTVSNPIFAEIMRDPAASGVDVSKPAFITYHSDPVQQEGNYTMIIFNLEDVNAFEQIVSKATLQDKRRADGFTVVDLDRLTAVGWKRKYVIFATADLIIDLDEKLSAYFNNSPSNAIISEPTFQQTLKQEGEMLFWVSMSFAATSESLVNTFGLANLPKETFEGNYIVGGVDFASGEMTGNAEFLFKPLISAAFNTFFRDDFEANFKKFVADENRGATFMFALNLPNIYRIALQSPDLKAIIENFLEQNGMNIDELFRTLSGDFLFINYYFPSDGQVSPFIATKIYRPDLIQKYLDFAEEKGVLQKVGEGFYGTKLVNRNTIDTTNTGVLDTSGVRNYHIILKENNLMVTSNYDLLQQIFYGGFTPAQQLKDNTTELMDQKFVYGEADFSKVISTPTNSIDNYESFEFNLSQTNVNFELRFKDKNTNTLQQTILSSLSRVQ